MKHSLKKMLGISLAAAMVLSAAACGGSSESSTTAAASETTENAGGGAKRPPRPKLRLQSPPVKPLPFAWDTPSPQST